MCLTLKDYFDDIYINIDQSVKDVIFEKRPNIHRKGINTFSFNTFAMNYNVSNIASGMAGIRYTQ